MTFRIIIYKKNPRNTYQYHLSISKNRERRNQTNNGDDSMIAHQWLHPKQGKWPFLQQKHYIEE